MLKLSFFVPETHLEQVKSAVFAAGAGHQGDYDSCCWQALGQGQFRPLAGSRPYLGEQDQVEHLAEYRVETLCDEACLQKVIAALREAHPYEEPAFDVVQLVNINV